MAVGTIYDLYKDDEYIGDYDGRELQEKFAMSQASFYNAASEGRLIRDHYRVYPVDKKIPKRSPLFTEFAMITKEILGKAGRA